MVLMRGLQLVLPLAEIRLHPERRFKPLDDASHSVRLPVRQPRRLLSRATFLASMCWRGDVERVSHYRPVYINPAQK